MKLFTGHEKITLKDIEDMMFQIAAYANQNIARDFSRLRFDRQQKITFILRNRARRARNAENPLDISVIREVIDDAKKDFYVSVNEDRIKL